MSSSTAPNALAQPSSTAHGVAPCVYSGSNKRQIPTNISHNPSRPVAPLENNNNCQAKTLLFHYTDSRSHKSAGCTSRTSQSGSYISSNQPQTMMEAGQSKRRNNLSWVSSSKKRYNNHQPHQISYQHQSAINSPALEVSPASSGNLYEKRMQKACENPCGDPPAPSSITLQDGGGGKLKASNGMESNPSVTKRSDSRSSTGNSVDGSRTSPQISRSGANSNQQTPNNSSGKIFPPSQNSARTDDRSRKTPPSCDQLHQQKDTSKDSSNLRKYPVLPPADTN